MSSTRRSGVNIPVVRDSRTYEQSCKDSFRSMTKSSKRIVDDEYQHSSLRSDTTAPTFSSESRPMGSSKNMWPEEFDDWSHDFHSKWKEDFDRRNRNIFSLQPVDPFDDDHDHFSGFRSMDTGTSRLREEMEREMQSLRQQMDSMSKFGPSHFSGPNNAHTVQSSSTRVYSSKSSTQHGSDPHDTITKSNVVESNQHSRTVDGQTISSSSHASSSTSAKGANKGNINSTNTPGALLNQNTGDKESVLQTIDNNCEKDADGKYHFKVHFDAKDFTPEDIDVSTADNRLTVCAKRTTKSDGGTSTREFRRTIELPHSIDHANFRCNLTNDGVLIVDAPITAPCVIPSIKSGGQFQSNVKPITQIHHLQVLGEDTILTTSDGRRLHLEVKIEPKYKPEELSIKIHGDYIIVTGQQLNDSQHSSCEFTHKIKVHEPIQHHTIENELIGHTLVIEACLAI